MSDFICKICGKSCASQRGVVLHNKRKHPDEDADSYDSFDDNVPQQQKEKKKEGPKTWRIAVVELDNGANFLFSCDLCPFMCLEKTTLTDHLKTTH